MHSMRKQFAGTVLLLRLYIRQDWMKLLLWLAGITAFTLAVAAALPGLFPGEAERQAYAVTLKNPAMVAIVGPSAAAMENYTLGAMFGHEMLLFSALAVAVMNILLAAGHTRNDEEEGRHDMLRSMTVGKLAILGASALELLGVNVLLAAANGFGLGLLGIGSMPLSGSLLYGAALGAVGFAFAAVTALSAQLCMTNRGTVSLALAILGGSYILRAMTDVSAPKASWLSPLAWSYFTEVYVNNRWLPVAVAVLFSVAVLAAALALNRARDVGAGYLPQRGGRPAASPALLSPLGLALRLQRTALISWLAALFVIGLTYGSVFGDLDSFFRDNAAMEKILPQNSGYTLTEQFLSVLMVIIAVMSAIPALTALFRLKGEEKSGRVEAVYSKAVSRRVMFLTYFGVGGGAGALALLLGVAGLYAAEASVLAAPISFAIIIKGALAYLPAILFLLGLGALCIGGLPRFTGLVWLYLVYCFIADYMGNLLQLPGWMRQLSVFGHMPAVPVEPPEWGPLAAVTVLAAVLGSAGYAFYKRRDLMENR